MFPPAVVSAFVLFAWLFVTSPAFATDASTELSRPNIVLVITDDQSLDLGCYGNAVIQTPNLDQLAAEGTRFVNAFATTASCSASRSVLLTGMHNHANGHYGHEHAYHHFSSYANIKSLPSHLAEFGYETIRIGKLHVAPDTVYPFDKLLQANPRNEVQMAKQVDSYLGNRDSSKPFFLYFCPVDPHRADQFRDDLANAPDSFGNTVAGYPGVAETNYDPMQVIVPRFLPDNEVTRSELAMYYQSISRMDQGIGALIASLKARGVWDNTILIFAADHGMAFPGAKTTVYDPGLRIPLIVRDPRVAAKGQVNDAMISMVDFAPTMLDLAGLEAKQDSFQGRSFRSLIGTSEADGWDQIFGSHTFHEVTMYYPMRVIRNRQYKLIWNIAHPLPFPFASDLWAAPTWQHIFRQGSQAKYGQRTIEQYIHRPAFELYDVESDPDEVNNLAFNPSYADLLAKMKRELREFQEKTKDPWVLKWEYE